MVGSGGVASFSRIMFVKIKEGRKGETKGSKKQIKSKAAGGGRFFYKSIL